MRLALNHVVTVIAALTLSCDTNTITKNLAIHLLQLKIHNTWMKFFWSQKDLKKF